MTIITTINPTTGLAIADYPLLSMAQLNTKIDASQMAYQQWRHTSLDTRVNLLQQLAQVLLQKKAQLAYLMAEEMGKPVTQGLAEVEKCSALCEHYHLHTANYLIPEQLTIMGRTASVYYQPLGPVLAIMPWNFPIWQALRAAIPVLVMGNTFLLKPAPNCVASSLLLSDLFQAAGFPKGIFQTLLLDNALTLAAISHDKIIGVTFTGSEKTGRIIAKEAGGALKRTVLELGGNDPALVLSDVDIMPVAKSLVNARLNNAGQVCISPKRIIVDKLISNQLIKAMTHQLSSIVSGSPMETNTLLGPLARADLRALLHQQVLDSQWQGAKLIIGGELPNGPGFYYPPTLLVDVQPGMVAFEQELFGPVIAIITANNEEEMITLANQSRYGLGASIYSEDVSHAQYIASMLEVGTCYINDRVVSEPALPFGGIKCSGIGRELAKDGLLAFANIKTVVVSNVS